MSSREACAKSYQLGRGQCVAPHSTRSGSHCAVRLGHSSAFDSLKLVNLIVAVEQRVEEEFGFAISAIANEKAMSAKSSPLRSVSTLAEFIAGIISEQRHG